MQVTIDSPHGESKESENEGHEEDDVSEYSQDSENDEAASKSRKKKKQSKNSLAKSRPKRTPKKRKPNHLKIHHESLRKRQLAQAKIRAEELQEKQQNKLSEVDRNRAEAIAKKFQTDSEEMRLKRMEDRMGLLKVLEDKRLMLLNAADVSESQQDQKENDGEIQDKKIVKDESFQSEPLETGRNESNDAIDDESSIGSESESDDELEFIPSVDIPKPKPILSVSKESTTARMKTSPNSVISFFAESSKTTGDDRKPIAAKNKFFNPRATLRNALKAKQFQQGNTWLARYVNMSFK